MKDVPDGRKGNNANDRQLGDEGPNMETASIECYDQVAWGVNAMRFADMFYDRDAHEE